MKNSKKCLIRQPAGLGDIFYLQKVADYFIKQGLQIIWPISNNYSYLKDYLINENIDFCSVDDDFYGKEHFCKNEFYDDNNLIFLPMQKFVMKEKYPSLNLSDDNWQNYVQIKRNYQREKFCFDKFKVEQQDFIFVNKIFASPPDYLDLKFSIDSDAKNVIENSADNFNIFNIFDYLMILEKANEIHTIETSFCYLVEILDTTDKLFMYPRKVNNVNQHPDYNYINGIYKKNWRYIQN
jgi:hypothetical protein